MRIDVKILERWYKDAMNDSLCSSEALSRVRFKSFLTAMWSKLMLSKHPDKDEKIADVEWMERNLERQVYIHCNHTFQAKMIIELQRQLTSVEFQKVEAAKKYEEEIARLKKNIR